MEMDKRSDPRVTEKLEAGGRIFVWEEYWEEDDAGFCCPDFVWELHTRLKVFDSEERLLRTFDFDSGQREKRLEEKDGMVRAIFCPSFALRKTVLIDVASLEKKAEHTEDIGLNIFS